VVNLSDFETFLQERRPSLSKVPATSAWWVELLFLLQCVQSLDAETRGSGGAAAVGVAGQPRAQQSLQVQVGRALQLQQVLPSGCR